RRAVLDALAILRLAPLLAAVPELAPQAVLHVGGGGADRGEMAVLEEQHPHAGADVVGHRPHRLRLPRPAEVGPRPDAAAAVVEAVPLDVPVLVQRDPEALAQALVVLPDQRRLAGLVEALERPLELAADVRADRRQPRALVVRHPHAFLVAVGVGPLI